MLRVDFNLVLTMINLVVLFLILRKFLFRPVMDIMEKREAMIADGLKNAETSQTEALELKSQYEAKLQGAKEESSQMIERAKQEAKAEYDRIVSDADNEAQKLIQSARDNMDMEREQAIRDMKSQVASLAMDAARKVLVNGGRGADDTSAYDQFLEETGDPHGAAE
ncbi:F0F1 ATP synthase subunit B [uncultured Merdimonas sp.]|uniref:F0F1 ATP synthase subunit B n=1 Tax=uncultured Merdimonas sp. TaxID=2023269 RepID=UPI00320A3A10